MNECLYIMAKREKWGDGLDLIEVEKRLKNFKNEDWWVGNRKKIFIGMLGIIKVADDKKSEKWCIENKTNKLYAGIYATFKVMENYEDGRIQIKIIDNFYKKGKIINKEQLIDLMGYNYFSAQSPRYFEYNLFEKVRDFGLNLNKEKEIIQIKIKDIKFNDLKDIKDASEKNAIIKIRIGQSSFRKQLINKYEKCCICGIRNRNLLIASHIKPWSKCSTNKEKVDYESNGLLLCSQHDKLFDRGYISFNDNGKIIISSILDKKEYELLNISSSFKLRINIKTKMKSYLKYHRELNKELLIN